MPMDLVEITAAEFDVDISLEYATSANFTGEPIYQNAICYLHQEASVALSKAIQTAANVGCRLRIYDAFRPSEAQWILWDHTPDPSFLADPKRGSPHSRGVAIDLTLTDLTGTPLEMGTPFDAFTDKSHHGNINISQNAQRNRLTLLGIMPLAGWDFYRNEWWHYQLFEARKYPLISNSEIPKSMMEKT